MRKCRQCGEKLRRVHRTFQERLRYLAVYRCPACHATETADRRYRLHLGETCRCPKCGTFRVTKLKARDHIDKMHTGVFHLFERMAGGRLYHCCFCRLQFYDRRRMRGTTLPLTAPAPGPIEPNAENPPQPELVSRVESLDSADAKPAA